MLPRAVNEEGGSILVDRIRTAFVVTLLLSVQGALAVEPGVDVAAPRVAISQVADNFVFQPARIVVEQGDWIRWKNVAFSTSHTTTSGNPCVADNLWNAGLLPGAQFTRQFTDLPGLIPYFCSPHCGIGMTGQVTVTTLISVQASDNLGTLTLTWSGGGGVYQVFRSDIPGFTGTGTVAFAPDGGDTGTTFTDSMQPNLGRVLYYLVMNKF